MSDPVSFQMKGWNELMTAIKATPKELEKIVAQMINDVSFRWRNVAVTHLGSRFILRSPRFVLSRMRVEKAIPGPIASEHSTVGSLFVRGKTGNLTFDGFARIAGHEIGETRGRTFTLAARGGEERAISKRGARLIEDVPKPADWDEVSAPQSRVQAMIRAMASTGVYGKTFIIPKGNKFTPGLYRIRSKRGYLLPDGRSAPSIQLLQRFDHKPTVHPWNWLLESMQRTVQHAPLQAMWMQAREKIAARFKHV